MTQFPHSQAAAAAAANSSPRTRTLFDAQWRFQLGDVSGAEAPGFDDSQWRTLDLPHDWSVELPRSPRAPAAGFGGFFQNGIGWYRKALAIDPAWAGQRVRLEFEGVYANAELFVDGRSVGVPSPYGYSPFGIDLSEAVATALAAGRAQIVIAVRVDNEAQPSSRWYTGSGIYRHVWLQRFAPTHLASDDFKLTCTALSAEQATLQIEAGIKSTGSAAQAAAALRLDIAVHAPDGAQVAAGSATVALSAGRARCATELGIPAPQAWSPESPSLYRVVAQLRDAQGTLLDELEVSTGLRTIEWSAERGFVLNGKSIKLNGGNLHHDNGILGVAAFDRAEVRKVELMKAAGFNAIRTAHNPHSSALLAACDRLGMLVLDEVFDVWKSLKTAEDYHKIFDQWHARDLEAWLRRDWNHPSVVFWSIGNEMMERAEPEGLAIATRLAALVRALDRSRPVTAALNADRADPALWQKLDPLCAQLDICGYNYELSPVDPGEPGRPMPRNMDWAANHAKDHARVPERIVMATESFQYEVFENWRTLRDHSYAIGDFVWTGIDYLGEARIGGSWLPGINPHAPGTLGSWPWSGAYCGDIDLTGWRKPVSHYRDIVWNGARASGPKLYMAVQEPPPPQQKILGGAISVFPPTPSGDPADSPSEFPWGMASWSMPPSFPFWDWPLALGKRLKVEVYSRYEAVRLYLNGERLGEQATGEAQQFRALFLVPYAAGELVAVGLEGGEERERFALKTGGPAITLRASVDRHALNADGQDLAFVTIEAVDEEGQWQLWADQKIRVEVSGSGRLAGLGTGNVRSSVELYAATECTLFQGRALAVIRAHTAPGEITVRIKAPGLAPGELTLSAR